MKSRRELQKKQTRSVGFPVLKDPVTHQSSASYSLLVISSTLVIFGLVNKTARIVGEIDVENALQFFYACAGLYFGRKFTGTKKED
jgi:hypothetical protein